MNYLQKTKISEKEIFPKMKIIDDFPLNLQNIEWDIQEAPSNNHSFPFFVDGIVDMNKYYGFGINWQFYGNRRGHGYVFDDLRELLKTGEKFTIYFKNKNNRKKLFKLTGELTQEVEKNLRKYDSKTLKNLNHEELQSLYLKLLKSLFLYFRPTMFIEPLDSVLDREFKPFYEKLNKEDRQHFIVLTLPHKLGFLQNEQLDLMRIALSIRKIGSKNKLIKLSTSKTLYFLETKYPKIYKNLENHREKYIWLRGGYLDTPDLIFSDIMGRLKEMLRMNNLEEEIERLENYLKITKKEKEKIFKKYKLPRKIKELSFLIDELSYLHDERKENTLKFLYLINRVLKEISRRYKISYHDLKFSMPGEIMNLLSGGKINKKILKERYSCFLYLKTKKESYLTWGKKAEKFWNKRLRKEQTSKTTIHGISAVLGKAVGKVSVIINRSHFNKFKAGQILVATMTRPEFVPLMQKAKAIITDQGGITSHAAIVARELGIPCLIGTKDATSVLKDGDLVEVDATHGIVKLLKRN